MWGWIWSDCTFKIWTLGVHCKGANNSFHLRANGAMPQHPNGGADLAPEILPLPGKPSVFHWRSYQDQAGSLWVLELWSPGRISAPSPIHADKSVFPWDIDRPLSNLHQGINWLQLKSSLIHLSKYRLFEFLQQLWFLLLSHRWIRI